MAGSIARTEVHFFIHLMPQVLARVLAGFGAVFVLLIAILFASGILAW